MQVHGPELGTSIPAVQAGRPAATAAAPMKCMQQRRLKQLAAGTQTTRALCTLDKIEHSSLTVRLVPDLELPCKDDTSNGSSSGNQMNRIHRIFRSALERTRLPSTHR